MEIYPENLYEENEKKDAITRRKNFVVMLEIFAII